MEFSLGEFNIVCKDLEASINFYQNIFNFELIEKQETYAHFKCQKQTISLLAFSKKIKTKQFYGSESTFSLDLKVKNLKEASIYFKNNKVEFAQEYGEEDGFFCIYDPDNLIWEIVQE